VNFAEKGLLEIDVVFYIDYADRFGADEKGDGAN